MSSSFLFFGYFFRSPSLFSLSLLRLTKRCVVYYRKNHRNPSHKRLPGNPASAAVTFALVVAPVLRKLAGWPRPLPRRLGVTLDRDTRTDAQRPEYARAALRWEGAGGAGGGESDGGGGGGGETGGAEGSGGGVGGGRFLATNTGNQISSRLLSMKGADVLLELPAGAGVMRSGTVVSALLYGDLRAMK